ncbi:hypothetical protein VH567_00335 [Sphingomonas sp. 4RDLI-65]|uniref:hypothetical protein n=1 Tax=Sphingomonas sp. 4RDLI-65 TaxID=3111641 RepID=UPI003C280D8A
MTIDTLASKRAFLTRSGALLASLGLAALADGSLAADLKKTAIPLDYPGTGPIPWFRRIFHLYTGPDGLTHAAQIPIDTPEGAQTAQFLRRTAERVTIGGLAANAGFGFHVANQPTLLIPIFGTMIVELHDGTRHELQHGDIAIAEDCSGKGHISRAGANGSFMVAVQLPKSLCPATGPSDPASFWKD